MTGASSQDRAVGLVAGYVLPTSLEAFIARAAVLLEEEQAKASPDTALVGFLCDAVRLAREYSDRGFAGLGRVTAAGGAPHEEGGPPYPHIADFGPSGGRS